MKMPVLVLLPAFLVAAACAGPSATDLQGSEFVGLVPAARITIAAVEQMHESPSISASVVIDLWQAKTDWRNSIDSGEVVEFHGLTVAGPAEIEVELDVWSAAAAWRVQWHPDRFTWEAGVGLEAETWEAEATSGGITGRHRETTGGLTFDLRAAWEPVSWVEPYFLLRGFAGGSLTTSTIELGAALRFPGFETAGLFVGFRRLHFTEESSGSDIDAKMRGVVVGLDIRF